MIDASVLVVGGGAIGGVTAAKLTGAVRRVVVLDASEEQAARLNEGLRLDELGEERTVKIEAVTEPPDEAFDFILVTLKAAHHDAVKPLKGTFVSLGNGLVQDRLEGLVGEGNLISGIWVKLLVNRVFSGLGAVAGQTYAEVVGNPAGKAVALRMWQEGYEVGRAQALRPGKVLGVEASALAAGDEAALGEEGPECGIPTPLHERVTELIHAAERGERGPSPDALAELERL